MLPICINAFIYTTNIKFDYNEINDEIALEQLREQLLIAYNMEVCSDKLNFRYKNKDFKLSLVNEKMILQPGTQIYLNNIDYLQFDIRNNCIYVSYSRQGKNYERVIGKAEGLYIDDFCNCNVFDDEHSDGQE